MSMPARTEAGAKQPSEEHRVLIVAVSRSSWSSPSERLAVREKMRIRRVGTT
jgi:hypothetical protein